MKNKSRVLTAIAAALALSTVCAQAGDQVIPPQHKQAVRDDTHRHVSIFFGGQPRQNQATYQSVNKAQTGQGMGVTFFTGYQPNQAALFSGK